MTTTFLEGLSENEQKQALLRISQFVLRESSGKIRDSLYQALIEVGLFLNDQKCTIKEIDKIIQQQFYGIIINSDLLSGYIDVLEKEARISIEGDLLCLSETRFSELKDYRDKTRELIQLIEFRFISKVEVEYPHSIDIGLRRTIINIFYKFIILLISKYVINTAKLLVKGSLTDLSMTTGSTLIFDSISTLTDQELRDSIHNVLMEWMHDPEDDFIEYLFNMRQNFLSLEILNLDPECRSVSEKEFSGVNIYLDTNIIMSYILRGDGRHEQTKLFIDNTQKIGCNIRVTKRTILEYLESYGKGVKEYTDFIGESKNITSTNPFLRNYVHLIERGEEINISDYLEECKGIELLLLKNNISIEDEIDESILNMDKFEQLSYHIQRCFKILRPYGKRLEVAEHDAYHMLLIKKLRETETTSFIGSQYWFLTYDHTLSCVDKYITRVFPFVNKISATMIGYLWDELISPFLIGEVPEKNLIKIFRQFIESDFIPISEGEYNPKIAKLDIDWTEYDWLEYEEIGGLVGQQFVLDYLQKESDYYGMENSEEMINLRSDFNKDFMGYISTIAQRRINAVNQDLEDQKRANIGLEERVGGLETDKEHLQSNLGTKDLIVNLMKIGSGISGFVFLAYGLYQMFYVLPETHSNYTLASIFLSLLFGVIAILLAIAPEQISAKINLSAKLPTINT